MTETNLPVASNGGFRLFLRFLRYSLAGCITLLTLLVLPGLVGVLSDTTAMNEAQAGWAAAAGFSGSALVALWLAFHMHHINLRQVALISFGAAVAGDLLSAYLTQHPGLFIACRFVTGLGSGAAYTAIVAAFAREPQAERGYGLFITLQFVISGIGLYILPVYSEAISARGLYLSFAVLGLAGMGLCRGLPAVAPSRLESTLRVAELKVLTARATLFGIAGFALFEAANTGQFTYVERFGVDQGLSDEQLGLAMLVGSLAGIPGAFAIVLTGARFGYFWPIVVSVLMSVSGLALLMAQTDYPGFFTAFCLLGFGWAFGLPYIQGLLARLDRGGSALAAGAGASTIGNAMGPAVAAMLLGQGAYGQVFLAAAAGLLLAALMFYFARSKGDSDESA